jgi:hypothetical protein
MRFVFLIATLAALSGCSSYRDVSFYYYPNAPYRDTFPRRSEFYAVADKECAKYGMRASYNWANYTPDFEKVRVNYLCVQ